ncbi:MAG: hypothetical protein BMS9Abin29_0339 [Gemmatimonadota bacterium]|nr:MAG: hypothetical protein BMS9Abin29_0339 [Gemmatimonadota bacterium]
MNAGVCARGRIALMLVLVPLAPTPGVLAQSARVGGFLSLDRRFEFGGDSVMVADFYNRFRPELSVGPAEDVYLFASLDFRFYDFPTVRSQSDLDDIERHSPTDVTLWEGYVQLWNFLVDGLDVRVGKQRIQWGTADEMNPTDRVNAYDFSDLVSFTARVPTWATLAEYYVAGLTLTGVWSPAVHPPIMPRGGGAALFGGGPPASLDEVAITSLKDRFELPSRRLSNGLWALKIAGNAGGADYSFSYVSGYDGVPFLSRLDLLATGDGTGADGFAGVMTLGFARTRSLGADVATDIRGIGLWGEAVLVLPEAQERVVTTTIGDATTLERVAALDGASYVRSTVGLDYTFSGGWYANAQWSHGLFFERGSDELHDYFMGRLERSFLQDELKVAFGGAMEVATWSGISDNLGYGVFPELTYSPADNVELVVGAFVVGGRGSSLFRAWDRTDQVYTRVKVSF